MSNGKYLALFAAGHASAKLQKSNPHRSRHEDASLDGTLNGKLRLSDSMMQERGCWASLASLQRYRKVARYRRQMEQLSSEQLLASKEAPAAILRLVKLALV